MESELQSRALSILSDLRDKLDSYTGEAKWVQLFLNATAVTQNVQSTLRNGAQTSSKEQEDRHTNTVGGNPSRVVGGLRQQSDKHTGTVVVSSSCAGYDDYRGLPEYRHCY